MATISSKMKYLDTLDNISRQRYVSKLQLIGGIDPYEVDKTSLLTDHKGLPAVTYPDIVNYFVNTQSAYTLEELKAYKSLESYNYFVCGWVRDLQHLPCPNDRILITAKVKHSQRLNEPPLLPWIISQKNGVVLAGHCTCMAGLGEACSHVGALLFAVEAAVKIRDSKTVTQEPAYWLLPTGISKVGYSEIQNIDFQSRQVLKRKLDNVISSGTPSTSMDNSSLKLPHIPQPTEEESAIFLRKLHETQDNPVLLSVMPNYVQHYVPSSLGDSFPGILTELYDEQCTELPREQLIAHCLNIFETITVTESQSNHVQIETREQSGSKQWYRFRAGRVTASRMKSVYSTTLENPAPILIKSICYPLSNKFSTKATKWGCEHEATALKEYCLLMQASHENFKCEKSGLVINPRLPYMGASPDSVVSCDCCGNGLLEIKCPFCVREHFLIDSLDSKSCLEENDGKLLLKKSHAYYYQIQAQLLVCNKEFVGFVVWTEVDMHVERIEPDEEFCNTLAAKSKAFFIQVILPELVGKLYSRPQPTKVNIASHTVFDAVDLNQASNSKLLAEPAKDRIMQPNRAQEICMCRQQYQPSVDRVVCCSNENCTYKWFHLNCLNRQRMPSCKTKWYCPACQKLPEFKKSRTTKASTSRVYLLSYKHIFAYSTLSKNGV